MMTLRQRVFLIISLGIAIILVILLYLLYDRKTAVSGDGAAVSNEQSKNITAPANQNSPSPTNPTQPTVAKPIIALPAYSEDIYVKQLAKIFVERFASYSTANNNAHIKDSMLLATPDFQKWLKTQMKPDSADYEGVVTQVLTGTIKEKTPTSATIIIQVQQSLEQKKFGATGATTKKIIQKKGTVVLVKIGDQWLVDSLYWE